MPSQIEANKLKAPQLRDALASRGLRTDGRKPILVERLQAKLDADADAAAEEAVAGIVDQNAAPEVAVAQVANAAPVEIRQVELASEEVVAKVVALQETVQERDWEEVAEAAVAEAVEFVESGENGNAVVEDEDGAVSSDVVHRENVGVKESNVTQENDAQDVAMEEESSAVEPNKEAPDNNTATENPPDSPPTIPAKTITTWDVQFNKLQAYQAQHGNCKVPKIYPPDPQLGRWVNTQRYKNNTRALNAAKKERLDSIHFEWTLREPNRSWKKWLKELTAYKELNGNLDVPQRCKDNKALGAFVSNVRSEYRKHTKGQSSMLNPKRIQVLEEMGFKWVAKKGAPPNSTSSRAMSTKPRAEEVPWVTRLNELADYRVRFGDCNVPKGWGENPGLGDWVEKLRQPKKFHSLTKEKLLDLDSLGFDWNNKKATWNTMISELNKFKQECGHCDVPIDWERNFYLGQWVDLQRKKYKQLTKDQLIELIELGFDFKACAQKTDQYETQEMQDSTDVSPVNEEDPPTETDVPEVAPLQRMGL